MKKNYVGLVMTPAGLELSGTVLTGSLTKVKIDIDNVSVEDYKSGFGTETDIAAGRDFKEISFD